MPTGHASMHAMQVVHDHSVSAGMTWPAIVTVPVWPFVPASGARVIGSLLVIEQRVAAGAELDPLSKIEDQISWRQRRTRRRRRTHDVAADRISCTSRDRAVAST